ncbi:MAG TPA: tripartite tricarboxylate transporter substrate binding protein [Afifellaceae bacterium]|nr:tripartite tricarboxylate transporter substrate binding protein [Afifellaceae bacterium]
MNRFLSSATRWSLAIAGVAALAGVATTEQARAEFPEKPVEMTVLFGGSAQTIAQMLADLMSQRLDQPVVAVSRTGGGGAVGYTYVHGTDADGYNIVWNSNSVSTAHHFGNMELNHEAFEPIARVSLEVPVMAVRKDREWETLQDMVDWSQETGQRLRIGHAGVGSFTHLTSAALFDRLGVEVNFIPYGQGREVAELLAGRIDAAMRWPSEFISHIEAGTLHPICVTGAEPVPVLPDTPTCAEAGAEGLNLTMWRGLAAPAGTPPEVIERLQEVAREATEDPAFQELAEKIGFQPAFLPAEEFAEVIATDDEVISGIVAEIKE